MNHKKDVDGHMKKIQKLEKENIELRTRLEEYSKGNRKLRVKNETLVKEIGVLQHSNNQLQKENQDIEKNWKQVKEQNKKMETKVNTGLKSQVSKVESSNTRLKEKIDQLENEIVRLNDLTRNQAREIDVLNGAIDSELKDESAERILYELSSTKVDNTNLITENEQCHSMINDLQGTVNYLTEHTRGLEEQLSEYQNKYNEMNSRVQQLDKLYSDAQREISDLEEDKTTLMKGINEKVVELDDVKHVEGESSRENHILRERLSTVERDLRICGQELIVIREKNNELTLIHQNRESLIDELSQKCNFYQHREHELRQQVGILSSENNSIADQLDTFSKMNYENQQMISESSSNTMKLKETIEALQTKNEILLQRISELDEEKKDELKKYKAKEKDLEKEITETKNDRKKVKTKCEELQKKYSDLVSLKEKVDTKLGEFESKYNRLDESKQLMQKTLVDQLTKERERVRELEREIARMKNVVARVEADNNRMQILTKAQQKSKETLAIHNAQVIKQRITNEFKETEEPPKPVQSPTGQTISDNRPSTPQQRYTKYGDSNQWRIGSPTESVVHTPVNDRQYQPTVQSTGKNLSRISDPETEAMKHGESNSTVGMEFVSRNRSYSTGFRSSLQRSDAPYSNSARPQPLAPSHLRSPTTDLSSSTPVQQSTLNHFSSHYTSLSAAAKKNPDKYRGEDGRPLDLFALAYQSPTSSSFTPSPTTTTTTTAISATNTAFKSSPRAATPLYEQRHGSGHAFLQHRT